MSMARNIVLVLSGQNTDPIQGNEHFFKRLHCLGIFLESSKKKMDFA